MRSIFVCRRICLFCRPPRHSMRAGTRAASSARRAAGRRPCTPPGGHLCAVKRMMMSLFSPHMPFMRMRLHASAWAPHRLRPPPPLRTPDAAIMRARPIFGGDPLACRHWRLAFPAKARGRSRARRCVVLCGIACRPTAAPHAHTLKRPAPPGSHSPGARFPAATNPPHSGGAAGLLSRSRSLHASADIAPGARASHRT